MGCRFAIHALHSRCLYAPCLRAAHCTLQQLRSCRTSSARTWSFSATSLYPCGDGRRRALSCTARWVAAACRLRLLTARGFGASSFLPSQWAAVRSRCRWRRRLERRLRSLTSSRGMSFCAGARGGGASHRFISSRSAPRLGLSRLVRTSPSLHRDPHPASTVVRVIWCVPTPTFLQPRLRWHVQCSCRGFSAAATVLLE